MDPAGIELTTSRLRQLRQLPVVQHVRFMPLKLCQKHNSNDMPEAALDNWQPIWNAQVLISTPVYVNFELRPGAGDIRICLVLILMLWHRETHVALLLRHVSVGYVCVKMSPVSYPLHAISPIKIYYLTITPDHLSWGNSTSLVLTFLTTPIW